MLRGTKIYQGNQLVVEIEEIKSGYDWEQELVVYMDWSKARKVTIPANKVWILKLYFFNGQILKHLYKDEHLKKLLGRGSEHKWTCRQVKFESIQSNNKKSLSRKETYYSLRNPIHQKPLSWKKENYCFTTSGVSIEGR